MVTIYITVEDYYNNGVFSNSKFNLAVSELPKSYNYVEFKIISTKETSHFLEDLPEDELNFLPPIIYVDFNSDITNIENNWSKDKVLITSKSELAEAWSKKNGKSILITHKTGKSSQLNDLILFDSNTDEEIVELIKKYVHIC